MHKRILVCDDHEGILDMLSILLENYDFEITVEKNSLHVDELIRRLNPDLLLVDLWIQVLSRTPHQYIAGSGRDRFNYIITGYQQRVF